MMSKNELVLPYKLEQHLVEICNSNTIYANLLSVWNINKKMCQDVLSTVVMNYPHYTKHDISHCEAIITNIEMLLGEEAIKSLSPTDTWLLLHAAYLHDIGMVIECKKIEENWESGEFQEYLHDLEDSNDDELVQNARFINSLGDKLGKKENVMSWPVRVRYAVTLLIADYYRRQHAEDSNSYIKDMGAAFHIDLGFNGLIPQRLIMLLADIVCLHTESSIKVLDLDYRTNGFNADYAHPRFLAQMLRMGDLLDADNNRFNTTNEAVFGEIPESSKNHWEKHMSARHILITPDVIEYRADCSKPDVYRETRVFLSWLKEEVEFWALNWKNIMPENIKGSAPRLGKCELLLNGVPDIQGLSDLRFSISPEKAFEVIEGSNIYEDQFVFLREVIQNALDACKIQLWRDISEERYRSWITHEGHGEIQPFEISQEVFENYVVEVRLCDYDDDHFKIIIKDNGIGLSAEQLKKICDVGVSYSGDKRRKDEINTMPLWLRPTAGFGIGLQSIFLIAEEFEIYSKSSIEEGIYARVASRRRNGYVQISQSNYMKSQGTEIHVVVSRDLDFRYGLTSNTDEYIEKDYDPFSSQKNILYYKIWDVLRDTMESTYFPIKLFFDGELVDSIKSQKFKGFEKCSTNDRYLVRQLQNYGMELWDNKTCTRMQIRLREKYEIYNNRYFFKGMEMKMESRFNVKGIWFDADFYGLDTKKTLALDRKRIRKDALEDIREIIDSAFQFYLDAVEKTLFEKKDDRGEREYNQIYTYWCMVSLKRKIELLQHYKEIFKNVQVPIAVLKKEDDNKFEECKIDFKDVVKDLSKTATIRNLSQYTEHKGFEERVKVELIKELLHIRMVPFTLVVVDKDFTEVLNSAVCSQIMIIEEGDRALHLSSRTIQERGLPELIDEETKKYLLGTLLTKNNSSVRYGFHNGSVRRFVTGIEEYAPICTTMVPFGIGGEWYHSVGYIISPVTMKQWEHNKHLEREAFVDLICESDEFLNLIEHVYLHQIEEEKYSKEEIAQKYKEFIGEMHSIIEE